VFVGVNEIHRHDDIKRNGNQSGHVEGGQPRINGLIDTSGTGNDSNEDGNDVLDGTHDGIHSQYEHNGLVIFVGNGTKTGSISIISPLDDQDTQTEKGSPTETIDNGFKLLGVRVIDEHIVGTGQDFRLGAQEDTGRHDTKTNNAKIQNEMVLAVLANVLDGQNLGGERHIHEKQGSNQVEQVLGVLRVTFTELDHEQEPLVVVLEGNQERVAVKNLLAETVNHFVDEKENETTEGTSVGHFAETESNNSHHNDTNEDSVHHVQGHFVETRLILGDTVLQLPEGLCFLGCG